MSLYAATCAVIKYLDAHLCKLLCLVSDSVQSMQAIRTTTTTDREHNSIDTPQMLLRAGSHRHLSQHHDKLPQGSRIVLVMSQVSNQGLAETREIVDIA